MTSLTPSPFLVALMQTATLLPVFLFGLPAGAQADILDRRKLLLVAETWLLLVAVVLGILTSTQNMSARILLALTLLMGLGSALDAPLWQAIVPYIVERGNLPAAVALNATGYNIARAVGPALGGLLVAAAGPAAVFFLNAVTFLWVLVAIYRWRRSQIPSSTPPEDMLGAIRWDFYRDLADPERYLEIFFAPSWAEHVRQHARVTVEDQEIEAHAFSFLQPGVEPVAAHLIDVRSLRGAMSADTTSANIPIGTQIRL